MRSNSSINRRRQGTFSLTCRKPRLNSLCSIWYSVLALAFQIYIVVHSVQSFVKYISLPWPVENQPFLELNAYVALIGAALILLPFFTVAGILKVGNFSNDGGKWGRNDDDSGAIYQNLRRDKPKRWVKMLWKHGAPTAPFLHVCAAFCLLLPRVLIQARLIQHGFLSKADLWKTDLDFIIAHRDRIVALKFLSTINETELWERESIEQQNRPKTVTEGHLEDMAPVSAEFLNYGLALVVYAVRYPSVFWRVNKSFAMVFSLEFVLTALQQLLAFTGFTVLYKIHIYGSSEVLLKFNPMLLNVSLSLLLFILYNIILTMSASVLYLYGLQKFRENEEQEVRKHHITLVEESRCSCGYIPHLSALLTLFMIISSATPLMYDYMLVYCGSLDGTVLAGVTGTILHVLSWMLLWVGLCIKQRWWFKKANNQQRSTKDTELELLNGIKELPLLVIENGHTYQVREQVSKQAILDIALSSAINEKSKSPDEDDNVYWLKPKFPLPKTTDTSPEEDVMPWRQINRKSSFSRQHKVTFEDKLAGASVKRTKSLTSKSPNVISKGKKSHVKFEDGSNFSLNDGDYASLRELVKAKEEDFESPTLKRLHSLRYSGSSRPLLDDGDYGILLDNRRLPNRIMAPVIVHTHLQSVPGNSTSRSTDSGITKSHGDDRNSQDNPASSSGSVSEASTSPDKAASDSSSGVHSSYSMADKRSSSLENIPAMEPPKFRWKNLSLQRNVVPPAGSDLTARLFPPLLPENKIYDDPYETTMVIRRQQKRPEDTQDGNCSERFGRATNMRMMSFTDQPDYLGSQVLSNTTNGDNSLFWTPPSNRDSGEIYRKTHFGGHPSHNVGQQDRRDSANFSLASSGDSENITPHF
ncbi:uncharacterized protein LOC143223709 [Tachypleus tridentatus]|uniref:uncharacterized protein LOC143223709 n=1 Tax=Tachypleus tridentatus TaxID=6853 RepID=UPI003FD10762